jgi:transcriptional regulator of acetoin/glycerol metabolism
VEKGGAKGTVKLDVPRVAVERPSAVAAVVRDGRDGIETLTLRMKVDSERDERDALIVRAREERVDGQIMSADALEMSRTTLWRKLREHQIHV